MSEIEETKNLLNNATFPSLKALLSSHLKSLEAAAAETPIVEDVPSTNTDNLKNLEQTDKVENAATSSAASASASASAPIVEPRKFVPVGRFIPIDDYAWDQDGYSSPTITIYIDLPGVGAVKQNCHVEFKKISFEFQVTDLNGKNYKLVKDNLEKDIIPEQSKMIVKANRVILKLQKVKGEYSYEHWTNLTAKKPRDATSDSKKKDPMGGIMDMMKDMYEDGDENMKKIIGEAMLKSQRGEKSAAPSLDGL